MIKILPEKLKMLAHACPFPLYVVGGACRDFLAGLNSGDSDYDICAPAGADEFTAIAESAGFTVNCVYKRTGTVKISADGAGYEFTCFRTDGYVRGLHTPAEIKFTDDIVKDALRRDFKCNAVYYDVKAEKFVDPLGGAEDIKRRKITTVAPAGKVFGEDGLRLMRLCRQAAQTGFEPSNECVDGAASNRNLIADISAERIWTELNLILHADKKYGEEGGQYRGLELMKRTGVLAVILPELALGDGMAQRSDFHSHDVLEHSLRCVKYADDSIRLAALLHDIGKPECMIKYGKFATHEEVGAKIAQAVCARLKVPKKTAEQAVLLTRLHMYDLNGQARESKVRRFIVKNYAVMPQLLLLKQADFAACKDSSEEAPCVVRWKGIIEKMKRERVPFTVKQLDVRGDELIAFGLPPEKTSATLSYLLSECALDGKLNVKEKLIKLAFAANRI